MNDQRLIELEIKMSYQEVQMDELQKVVNDQYLVIQKMEKTLKEITNKLKAEENSANPTHEKPPHY